MEITVFYDVSPFRLQYGYQLFRGSFYLHPQGVTVSQAWKSRGREKKTVQV